MNPSEEHLEQTLRQAPQPAPDPGLRARIVESIALPPFAPDRTGSVLPGKSWLQRWWPALVAGGLAGAAFAVVVIQQGQIQRLEQTIEQLKTEVAPPPDLPRASQPAAPGGITVPQPNAAAELKELRTRTQQMAADVKALEAMQSENTQLKAQTAAALGVEPEVLDELAKAKEKAQRIACVNNLKQLGLAARIWATDNGDVLPPDIVSMSNEIAAPKILVCPADTGRQPASDWFSFSAGNTSYEFLAANGSETEPQRVAFRCPIHGNVGLADGSVQMSAAKDHPEWFVQRDGKLMLEVPQPSAQPATVNPSQPPQMDVEMLRRYGLLPPQNDSTAPPAEQPAAPEDPQ